MYISLLLAVAVYLVLGASNTSCPTGFCIIGYRLLYQLTIHSISSYKKTISLLSRNSIRHTTNLIVCVHLLRRKVACSFWRVLRDSGRNGRCPCPGAERVGTN